MIKLDNNPIPGQATQQRFKSLVLEQFYHGLIIQLETSLLICTDKDSNSEFIKIIPILLEELHRLELYIKTLRVDGIKLDRIISKLLDLWLLIFEEELHNSVTKLISFETWLPIDESILHTESVADFFTLVHSYSNVLSELI